MDKEFDRPESTRTFSGNEQLSAATGAAAPLALAAGTAEPPWQGSPVPDGKSYLEAPYRFSMEASESVSLNSGGLTHTAMDFVLPGRNGFDFAIARRYNSDNAAPEEMDPVHIGGGRIGTGTRPNQHYNQTYGLGYGWQFVLPSVDIVPEANQKYYLTYTPFLHLEDGRTFAIENGKLKDHPQTDVTVDTADGSIAHPCVENLSTTYNLAVRYKNGNSDYFQKRLYNASRLDSYTLVARQDRFGNSIFFKMKDYGGMIVTDTWGRTLRLERVGYSLVWTLPGGIGEEPVTLRYDLGTKAPQLAAVTDQAGRTTRYTYHDQTTYAAVCKYADDAHGDTSRQAFASVLLKSIQHPTGATTEYDYGVLAEEEEPGEDAETPAGGQEGAAPGEGESTAPEETPAEEPAPQPLKLTLGEDGGYRQFFPLCRRRDMAEGREYQPAEYRYQVAEDGKYVEHADVALPGEVAEKHTFNDKSQLTRKEVRHAGKLATSAEREYGTEEKAADYKLLVKETTRRYNPDREDRFFSKETLTTYTEDMKADVAKITETYPEDETLNQETVMAYGAYSILTSKSWKKDANTTLQEAYTLRTEPDDKVVEYRRLYENSVLKEKTQYLYGAGANNAYCVVEERRFYTEAAQQNLDEAETFVATKNRYSRAQCTHSPVETVICGLRDSDGEETADMRQRFAYDACGRPLRLTDGLGRATFLQYDALGRTLREIYPAVDGVQHCKSTHYNDAKNHITTTDENGWKQRVEYTPLGLPVRVYAAQNNWPGSKDVLLKSYEYDERERPTAETLHDGAGGVRNTTRYTYDWMDRLLTKTVPETDTLETHVYEDLVPGKTDEARLCLRHTQTLAGCRTAPSVTTSTEADGLGRVLREYQGPWRTAEYTYDKAGNKLTHTDAGGLVTETEWDYAGNAVQTRRRVNGALQTSATVYNALGLKTESADWMGNKTFYTYDAAGRQLAQSAPFDETRRAETRYDYDQNGNLTRQRVEAGGKWRTTVYAYDARGRQTEATLWLDEAGETYSRTRYVYDGVGNKTQLRTGYTQNCRAAAVVQYTYGRFGNLLQTTDALGQAETCEYDPTGLLLRKTGRNGDVTAYAYDAAGRLVEERATAETRRGPLVTLRQSSYTRTGQKASERQHESGGGLPETDLVIQYRYDSRGRLCRQKDPAGVEKTCSYTAAGARRSFVLKRGGETELALFYGYDALNRLTSLRQNSPEGPLLAEYAYDANGRQISLRRPLGGLATLTSYNRAGLVTRLANLKNGAEASVFRYGYTPDGNQVEKECEGLLTTYEYDLLGRLVKESDPAWNTLAYTYDRFGNRAQMTVTPANCVDACADEYTTAYTYDLNNRLLLEEKTEKNRTERLWYGYDANGSQTRKEREVLEKKPSHSPGKIGFVTGNEVKGKATLDTRSYNGFGQQVGVTLDTRQIRYSYRPDGMRHGKTVKSQTTLHHWDGQSVVLESNAQNRQTRARYVRGSGLIAQVVDLSLFFYLFNAHGDVIQRVRDNGQATPTYRYDAFGNQKPRGFVQATDLEETDPNPFRYCGEYFDAETGEVYLRARYYDTATGRFGREDPAKAESNWYTYCKDNPINFIDPFGLDAVALSHSTGYLERNRSVDAEGLIVIDIDIYSESGISDVQFKIDQSTGKIIFDTAQANNRAFLDNEIVELELIILATAMFEFSVEYAPQGQIALKGRTVQGVATEIWRHYEIGSTTNIRSIQVADIGSSSRGWDSWGYDSNGSWFEPPRGWFAMPGSFNPNDFAEYHISAIREFFSVQEAFEYALEVVSNGPSGDLGSAAQAIAKAQIQSYMNNPSPSAARWFNIGSRPPSSEELARAAAKKT